MRASFGLLLLSVALVLQGCATGGTRILSGAGFGVAVGALGGAVLSPNDENRGLNSLVFGLGGGLAGALIGLLTDRKAPDKDAANGARSSGARVDGSREVEVMPEGRLPEFVRARLKPMVIEEYIERDSVAEDGSLHEPHKVFRIKRLPELYSKPVTGGAR